ncbi:MAG TPA: HAMP domain-containing sensor histidine kinase [Bryobacteraceae bacterium]|nr:HAMP domain-containing sensor histidine kinase [Bryobacteraceae bacterium]
MKPVETLKAATDHCKVLDRMRSHWLANVIHDISGALFGARGYLRMVLEEREGVLSAPQRRYLTTAQENLSKLAALTQELNDFAGADGFDLHVVDFAGLLNQAAAASRAAFSERKVQVVVELDGSPLSTCCDADKLALAMRIFLASAFEFTGSGGTVRVRAREENEKIVLQFTAGPPQTRRKEPAPDLSLAFRILRLHGGTASISAVGDVPDEGYVVTCELPVIRLPEC